MQTKFIFVTGGVVSSLGKGIMASSVGQLLKKQGFKVIMQKFDPYINVSPGSLSPDQHGEVFVTDDGWETDLDLGHYERFLDENLNKDSSITTGQIYARVIEKEKKGCYKGATVQVIPHITNEIKKKLSDVAKTTKADIVITEIGGTVGDIESLPFLEAIRQARKDFGHHNTLYIHTTLLPYLKASNEIKTKPTQHSIKELMSLGISPDMLVLRSENTFSDDIKEKLAIFTDVPKRVIFESVDVDIVYEMILNLRKQNIDEQILKHFKLKPKKDEDLNEWEELISKIKKLEKVIRIAVVGKYVSTQDAYLSVIESLRHAGYQLGRHIEVVWLDSSEITNQNIEKKLKETDGLIIPGGYGKDKIKGILTAIEYARKNNIPFFGICLGIQLTLIEFAKNVLKIKDANSMEFEQKAKDPIIIPINNKQKKRIGKNEINIVAETVAYKLYQSQTIYERHRHSYVFNTNYQSKYIEAGMIFSGYNAKNGVEIIEYPKNDFYIAVQFHPEYISRPLRPHPLFLGFVNSAIKYQEKK